MFDVCTVVARDDDAEVRPRLWTTSVHGSWTGVGRLVDAHNILQTITLQLGGGLFLAGLALALGANELLIGLLASLPLAARLSQLYLSWRIERAGHWRRTALISAAIARVPLFVVALLALSGPSRTTLALLVAALAVSALGTSAFELSFSTWMAEVIPEPLRGVFWGRRGQIGGAVGTATTLLAAWLLGDASPESARFPHERLAEIFAMAGVCGAGGLVFLRCLPEARRTKSRGRELRLRDALHAPLADRNYRSLLVFSAGWSFASGLMAPFYTVYMFRTLHLSFLGVSLLTAVTSIVMSVSQVYWGRLGDHFGAKPVLRIGSYLIAICPLFWVVAEPQRLWTLLIAQALSGIGWSAFHVSLANLTLKLAPEPSRPSYLASFGATSGIAEATGPLVGGAVIAYAQSHGVGPVTSYHAMMLAQSFMLVGLTGLPSRVVEPGGTAVGHLIRVMARYRTLDASAPRKLIYEHAYMHLARLADLIAREFPHDAEKL